MNNIFIQNGIVHVKYGNDVYKFEEQEGIEIHGITPSNREDLCKYNIVGCYFDSNDNLKTPILWTEKGEVFTGDGRYSLIPVQELKPCPFCGGWLDVVYVKRDEKGYKIECDSTTKNGCGCNSGYHDTEDNAKKSWNTRVC